MRTAILSLFLLAACGKGPVTPAGVDGEPPPGTAPVATPAPAASEAPAEAPHRQRKPFEVYNTCNDVVMIVFAADPKGAGVGQRTVAPSGSIDGPRDNDGNQTVWLLDANGEPLVSVHVTRGMKRVEVGKSCRTLDAR